MAFVQPSNQFMTALDPYTQTSLNKQSQITGEFNKQSAQDMARGAKRGSQLFGEGSFGRTDTSGHEQLAEMLKRRQGGFTSGEYQGLRNKMHTDIGRQAEGGKRDLVRSQAMSGVSGATASAQFAKAKRTREQTAQEGFQNLMIANINEKNNATARYGSALNQLKQLETANLDRAQAEKKARYGVEMGYGALGAANRAGAGQFVNAMQEQQQANNQKTGGSAKF